MINKAIINTLILVSFFSGLSLGQDHVNLTLDLMVDPVPGNALYPNSDSNIIIRLYKDAKTNRRAYASSMLSYDESSPHFCVDFDSLPAAPYSLLIIFKRYDMDGDIIDVIDLYSDTTMTVVLKPPKKYLIMVSADPDKYYLYFGYLKSDNQTEPSEYSLLGAPESYASPPGSLEFLVLSEKRWKLMLTLDDQQDGVPTKINMRFSQTTFDIENPFETEFEPPFDWIKVEKLE